MSFMSVGRIGGQCPIRIVFFSSVLWYSQKNVCMLHAKHTIVVYLVSTNANDNQMIDGCL